MGGINIICMYYARLGMPSRGVSEGGRGSHKSKSKRDQDILIGNRNAYFLGPLKSCPRVALTFATRHNQPTCCRSRRLRLRRC